MQRSKFSFLVLATLMIVLVYSNVALAGVHTYARSFQNNHAYRRIKGGFKIPSIDAKWANNNSSFITFEMWITVNAAPDWFEMGYMDGALDPENDGTQIDHRGMFKAKRINGAYVEWQINKTVNVGERHAFEIADANNDNIWDILINSTSYGTFSNQVPPVDADKNYMGYEHNPVSGVTPVFGATDINSQYYRSQGQWRAWNNGLIYVGVEDTNPYIVATWNPNGNSTTLALQ